jgi:hypothetical protein
VFSNLGTGQDGKGFANIAPTELCAGSSKIQGVPDFVGARGGPEKPTLNVGEGCISLLMSRYPTRTFCSGGIPARCTSLVADKRATGYLKG